MKQCRIRLSLHPRDLQSASYLAFRRRFASSSTDELQLRGSQLGKASVGVSDRPEAHALLVEATARARSFSIKGFRDLCTMAYNAGFHRECLNLFNVRMLDFRDDPTFHPTEKVIDAAYQVGDVDQLFEFGKMSGQILVKYSREVLCDFALWRVMWRLACISAFSLCGGEQHRKLYAPVRENANSAAEKLWKDVVRLVNPELFDIVEPRAADGNSGATDQAMDDGKDGEEKRAASRYRLRYVVIDVESGGPFAKGFPGLFRRLQRMALYHRAASTTLDSSAATDRLENGDISAIAAGGEELDIVPDDGEGAYFAFCKDYGLLRFRPADILKSLSSDQQTNQPPVNAGNVEQYYFTLVSTCRRGLYVQQAIQYFEEYRGLLEKKKASLVEKDKDHASSSTRHNVVSSAHDQTSGETDLVHYDISESFLFQLFTLLQVARSHKQTMRIAEPIVRQTSELSATLWTQVLLAASEERNLEICRIGFDYAFLSLQNKRFTRGDSESSMEYLLQTSLHALAKCHAPNLVAGHIDPCIEQKLLSLPNETVGYLMVQNALHAPDALEHLEFARSWIREKHVEMTTRIASVIFKVYMRTESSEMLVFYKDIQTLLKRGDGGGRSNASSPAKSSTTLSFKRIWLDELIICADRRRYFLTQDDRKYIYSEIERVYGKFTIDPKTGKFSTAALEGLRTQVALLVYDMQHEPLKKFKEDEELISNVDVLGIVAGSSSSSSPPPPPPLTDPRCYFLVRRSNCCVATYHISPTWKEIILPLIRRDSDMGGDFNIAQGLEMSTITSRQATTAASKSILHSVLDGREISPGILTPMQLSKQDEESYRILLTSIVEGVQASSSSVA